MKKILYILLITASTTIFADDELGKFIQIKQEKQDKAAQDYNAALLEAQKAYEKALLDAESKYNKTMQLLDKQHEDLLEKLKVLPDTSDNNGNKKVKL